jgi:hypothetical protein
MIEDHTSVGGPIRICVKSNSNSLTNQLGIYLILAKQEKLASNSLANCRAYSPGTHTRKDEDGLLLEFPCNPIRTRSV